MKKLIMIILFLIAVSANAQTNLQTCLEYMTTNYPESVWVLQDDGQGAYIKAWSSTMSEPTLAQSYMVWPQAEPWKSNQVVEAKSNMANWKTQGVNGETLKDAFVALVICINKRLPDTNKITMIEFKTELKAQLQQ